MIRYLNREVIERMNIRTAYNQPPSNSQEQETWMTISGAKHYDGYTVLFIGQGLP